MNNSLSFIFFRLYRYSIVVLNDKGYNITISNKGECYVMENLKKIINKMYIDELAKWGTLDKSIDEVKILSNVFAKMEANVRIDLMKLVGVYYRGTIREKREACVSYMLSNIINDVAIEDAIVGEFVDFKDLKEIPPSNVTHSKDRVKKEVITADLDVEGKSNITKHSKDVVNGLPIDVIKTVLRGKGLESLDDLFLDKAKNIVTCVKSGKRMSMSLTEEDFQNTRIILDLLSISYKYE